MANDDETAMEQWVSGRDDLELEEDGSITNTETGSNTREDDNTPDTSQKQSNSQSDAKSKQSQQDTADKQTAQEIVEENTTSKNAGSGGSGSTQQTGANNDQSNTNTAASELTSIERYLLRNPQMSAGGKTAKDVMRENNLSQSEAQDIAQRTEASDKIENKVQKQSDLNPDLGPDDVRETDSGQFVPDESGQTKIERENREQMVDQADKSLDEQFGRDLQRGEDYVLEENGNDGLQPRLTESFRREQAADQIEQKVEENTVLENVDIESDQLVKDGDSYRPKEQVATELFEDRRAANRRDINQNNGKQASPTQRRLEVEQKVMEAGVSADQIPGVERQNVRKFSGEEIEQNIEQSIEENQTGNQAGSENARQQARQGAIEKIQSQTEENLTPGEDFTVSTEQTDSGVKASASLTDQGRKKLARRSDDIFSGVVEGTEDALSAVVQVQTGSENAEVDIPGEGSVANVAREEANAGETDLTADLGPVSDAGDVATAAGDFLKKNAFDPFADASGDVAEASATGFKQIGSGDIPIVFGAGGMQTSPDAKEEAREVVSDIGRSPENEQSKSTVTERAGEGVGSGTTAVLNVPAVAGTAVDAVEFGAAGADAAASGSGRQFAEQAGGQATLVAEQATQYAVDNPVKFAGEVGGSAVLSTAAISGAAAVGGSRAARAASVAIQPGEELAVTAARRGLISSRAATGQSTSGSSDSASRTERVSGAGSDLSDRIGETVRKLAKDDRATGQFRFDNSRSETDPETNAIRIDGEQLEIAEWEPKPTQDLLRTDITQSERRAKMQRRAEEGGMSDAERFDANRGDTMMERRPQRRQADRRREEAQRREVRENDQLTPIGGKMTRALTATEPSISQGQATAALFDTESFQRSEVEAGVRDRSIIESREEVGRSRFASRFEIGPELLIDSRSQRGLDLRVAQSVNSDFKTETEQKTRTATETEVSNARLELGTPGNELRTEIGAEAGRPPEKSRETPNRDPRPPGPSNRGASESSPLGGSPSAGDDTLSTGWLRETIATAALGIDPEAARAPSQDTLESQPLGAQLTGELPTAAEVSGSQAEQDAIEDVSGLFSFGGGFNGYF